MKSGNYIVVIGWMINELNLSGNELLAYALIYGFSQDGETECKSSQKYISEALNCCRSTTVKVLNSLVEKNLISKRVESINDVKFNRYSIVMGDVQKSNIGSTKNTHRGSTKSVHNNTNYYNNKDNNRNHSDFSILNKKLED